MHDRDFDHVNDRMRHARRTLREVTDAITAIDLEDLQFETKSEVVPTLRALRKASHALEKLTNRFDHERNLFNAS